MLIGESIQQAIDWTQDKLTTTRPLAERTLFRLLAEKQVTETESGYVLLEQEGGGGAGDTTEDRLRRTTNRVMQMGNRHVFHKARANFKSLREFWRQKHLGEFVPVLPTDELKPEEHRKGHLDALS